MVVHLLIAADGSLSLIRQHFLPDHKLRYSGYSAWRGVFDFSEDERSDAIVGIKKAYPEFGNCLYFDYVNGSHCVLFVLRNKRLNWIWYFITPEPDTETGPYEITTRWTMVMTFALLPWKPQLAFTGISVMGVNPKTQKFCSHVDLWDSIENNDYFSFEGFLDVLKQLRYYKTPDLESPKYQILKRTATYEVRKYDPFVVAETKGEKLSGPSGFNNVAGYIFGKNSTNEKIPMTTPVFTQAVNDKLSEVSIQIVLPMNKELENLPSPAIEAVKLRKVEGGIAAAMKFSGKPTEEVVFNKEKELRSTLLKAGLKP